MREILCEECHSIEADYRSEGRRLCAVCYFGDNIGLACSPGECEFPSCVNYFGIKLMNPNEYQQLAMRTKADPAKILERLSLGESKWMQMIVAFMGLVDEIGEVAGPLKKKIEYNGAEPDPVNMKEEIGDMLWRIAQLADAFGLKLEDCMTANISKLAKRYPSHYTDQQALNRDLEEERKALGPDEAFSMLFESAKEVQSESPEKLWSHGIPTAAGRYEGKFSLNESSYTFNIDFNPALKPWPGELPFYRRIG